MCKLDNYRRQWETTCKLNSNKILKQIIHSIQKFRKDTEETVWTNNSPHGLRGLLLLLLLFHLFDVGFTCNNCPSVRFDS